jgi:uncharacterized protein (DUF934 family)
MKIEFIENDVWVTPSIPLKNNKENAYLLPLTNWLEVRIKNLNIHYK